MSRVLLSPERTRLSSLFSLFATSLTAVAADGVFLDPSYKVAFLYPDQPADADATKSSFMDSAPNTRATGLKAFSDLFQLQQLLAHGCTSFPERYGKSSFKSHPSASASRLAVSRDTRKCHFSHRESVARLT
jgi:hypothetical protein